MLLAGGGGGPRVYPAKPPKSATWRRYRRGRIPLDLRGMTFGRLRVVDFAPPSSDGHLRWRCICDPELGGCGKVATFLGRNLRKGASRSCGCLRRERNQAQAQRILSRRAFVLATRALEALRVT